MDKDVVIRAEGVGKKYVLGQQRNSGPYRTLRDTVSDGVRNSFRAWRKPVGSASEAPAAADEFWALQDIDFTVKRGEVVGVIGRNGAGKSTLLKVLSRITEPTTGRIMLKGRVASLLEVGTGFHPELTGRENIFLNGAILGMHRREIKAKFDEIVAFAEVERFLDTPVKRYSSGMYVRLAFAVASHLEPEILVVDEVLAVGDTEFQKKCLGKMQQVSSGEGRTVLFVSHNLAAVRSLCTKGVFLQKGRLVLHGSVDSALDAYENSQSTQNEQSHVVLSKPPDRSVWMETVGILRNNEPGARLEIGDRLSLKVTFRASKPVQHPKLGYLIRSARGENAVNANNHFLPSVEYSRAVMSGTIVCELGALPLMAGAYTVSFWLCRDPQEQHHVEDVLHFSVEEKDIWGTGKLPTGGLSCLWWDTNFLLTSDEVSTPINQGAKVAI